jgi:hypothetical protein
MRIHAICLALNEAPFITPLLTALYPFCAGISIISQYDRDFYAVPVVPDNTLQLSLGFPDPDGKIHVVCRRFPDEAAARNHEMSSLCSKAHKTVMSHGVSREKITKFYAKPDYFLIVDADEIFDTATLGNIIEYLAHYQPRGLRLTGYQYKWTWNQRIPITSIHHHHFGFIRPGVLFKQRRRVSWSELRLQKMLKHMLLPDIAAKVFGFMSCPESVGVFHHGAYLGGLERLQTKFAKHSHKEANDSSYFQKIVALPYDYISSEELPEIIRTANWPTSFFGDPIIEI